MEHRAPCLKLVSIGFLGTIAQAVALLSLVPVVRSAGASRDVAALSISPENFDTGQYIVYVAGITVLFLVAVRMKYRVFSMAYGISGRFAADCAERAFTSLQARLMLPDQSRNAVQGIVNRCLFRMPIACSVLFRQSLLALNDAFLLVMFLAILFYLSPAVTLVIIVLATPFLLFYLKSYGSISARAEKIDHDRGRAREEVRDLVGVLRSRDTTPEGIGRHVRDLFDRGHAGEALAEQMTMRIQMKGSSALVELITPVSVVVIAVLVFFSENLGFEMATILIYYIVLRQTIGVFNQIADSLVMINRVYPDLRDYARIVNEDMTPSLEKWLGNFERNGDSSVALDDGY